ncbi:LEAF RUST 10 DISEASE-RESISTANCE LOCUS RECEPTOR-LIKE PROTEIN KINASE-like 2.5 [Vicia villosa]|uniref:LEAF RUST 10 DISEASE-RESISTANCE LOCUS RECEPTOR-LIKE PROTEIN KINASE-like 2.5 n=1 Tax=Vicia villosa TaxID=3911 RepID=UPI00273C7E60|nr:LEAF RUST 10 DISEASE-RESISTANCE LOCUS RECEPTOR-LIKE PROTEIN KINASE-like 2.5 [Vicia villosa]
MKILLNQQTVFLSILLFIIPIAITNAVYEESDYMSDLIKSLTPTPSTWSNTTHYCKWKGIFCESNRVVSISLPSSSLSGTLPPHLYSLTNLTHIDLHNNSLTGPLANFSGLGALEAIYLGHNNFDTIPNGCFQAIPSLKILNLSNNLNLQQWTFGGEKDWLKYVWIAGASVGFIIFIGLIIYYRKECLILVQRWIFRGTTKSSDHIVENFMESYKLSVPIKQYRYAEVKRMTNSFRDKLGQGGYGTVYKASLPDGRHVAVKVIKESKGNGEEFINEVASISRTSHVNIVSLLGFCYGNKRALIYEFMSKGSLDNFILKSGSSDSICSLDWNTLSKIAMGIARGLEYLHQGCISRILHLDIKPQNILLDEDFCPKISDFGLAKICQRDDSVVSILGARGTIGYIAPEVFSRTNGGVSHKSDVYSYGMLILDMIGRRKNSGARDSCTSEYFPDWIYKDLEQDNNSMNCIANTEEENDMVRKITMVSLWCIQTKPSNRPSISKVIEMLQAPLQSVPYPPKPFLYSPEIPILQTSCVPSSSLSETKSSTLSRNRGMVP